MKYHVILNSSPITDDALIKKATETMSENEMYGGLWAIEVLPNGDVDCSFFQRHYKPEKHNAIVLVVMPGDDFY